MTREPGTPCGGGCGRGFGGLTPNDWFRCFHCRKPFCPECSLGHFGDRDELQARLDLAEFKYEVLVAQIRLAAANAELDKLRAGQTWISGPPTEPGEYWLADERGTNKGVQFVGSRAISDPVALRWVRWHRPVVHPPIPDRSEP